MSNFNPREPITDPSVFAPRGMYVDNRRGKRVPGEEEDDEKSFVFDSSDMKALNRFLGTGRRLQTTRAEYLRWLGIADNPGEVSKDLGKEVETLVGTYSSIKKDCVEFKDVTWIRIVDIAGEIKSYATMSGGKVETSYYALMLKFIGDYHDENRKTNPDKAKLAELKESIQFTVDAEMKKLGELQAGAAEALTGLGNFERVCERHAVAIEGNKASLEGQLDREGNEIESLKAKIKEAQDNIDGLQKQIDERNNSIANAPWYMLLGLLGGVIAISIIVKQAKNDIERMTAAMKEMQNVLDEHETRMRTASRLLTNLNSISDQVSGLGEEIGPAMQTLQKLQGAWKNMETDLKSIKDLVEFDSDSIPPMMITKPQLQGIVDEWNELKDYASRYIENAYLSENPKSVTIKQYINELENAVRTIEAMQEEEVKG